MTDKNRPPLPADQLTGLRVAGWHLVHEDARHEEAHRTAAESARADKAEHRAALAGTVLRSIAAEIRDAVVAVTDGSTVDDQLLRLNAVLERLEAEAEFFSPTTTEVAT